MPKNILYLGLDPTHYESKGKLTHWPIIRIVPRPLSDPSITNALNQFACYTHVIITSKSTVEIMQAYFHQLEISIQEWTQKCTLAVGKVTAAHLQKVGIVPQKVAAQETAEGIIEILKELALENAHVFWPHSGEARDVIKNYLTKQNISHTSCVIYDPQVRENHPLPILDNFDEIVFTSPSTVKAFLQIFGEFPTHTQLTPIGPITANFLDQQRTNIEHNIC